MSSNEFDVYECYHCKLTLQRRKIDGRPQSSDGGRCQKNTNGAHQWEKK
jgi:hypothetical protein